MFLTVLNLCIPEKRSISSPLPILIPDSSSYSHNHRMRLPSIVRLAKKKNEKYSQPPQVSPARCWVEEGQWAIILTGLLNGGWIEYSFMFNLSAPSV